MSYPIQSTSTLDTSGKCCPMPIVETNKTMRSLSPGEILQIIATDPGTQVDIPSWCQRTGNELLSTVVEDKSYTYYVKKQS